MQCDARGIIKRQVDQMARLVDDLLDISRITRDKIELRKEIVDVSSLIKSALETSRPAIDAANHHVKVNAPTKPLFINVDPARFSQVFSNLLNNATKYTEAGGVIEVTARQEGGQAVVSVRDNGIGIECEELAHVFDMFRQVDQSLEKSRGGLGIGLTLVRRLVELHGGSVNAQSEGPGKGCEFTVRMPLAVGAKASKRAPKLRESKEPVNKHRILVVDDNRDAGQTLAMLLRVKGHDVELARDGLEAVAATETFRPNVIFMDVGMPKLNGYEATERIRKMEFGKEIVIVALTGWGQASDVARSLDAGCTSHLVKPVEFADVERLLAAAPIMN
jgi:CheY-like chemotaxis protein